MFECYNLPFSQPYKVGDVIGCAINCKDATLHYWKNGEYQNILDHLFDLLNEIAGQFRSTNRINDRECVYIPDTLAVHLTFRMRTEVPFVQV